MSLWGDGGLITKQPAVVDRNSRHAPPVEGNTQTHEAMMALGSKLLLEAMMTAPRVRK